mgnify:CR=1 FL=1
MSLREIDIADDEGWSALHAAALKGCAEVVKILVDAGADLNAQLKSDGRTPLHFAAVLESRLDAAIELINAGADVTLTDNEGRTPFDMPNGRAVREYYESRLAAKAISEAFASGPVDSVSGGAKQKLML